MQRKLAGYLLLSFLSFTVFTTLFITVASAQVTTTEHTAPFAPSVLPPTPSPTPTTTLVAKTQQPTATPIPSAPTVKFTLQSPEQPTATPTPEPKKTETQNEAKTQTIAAQTTAPAKIPTPTAIPTIAPTAVPTALPTATPIPQPTVTSPGDLDGFFDKYSSEYGVDKEDLKRIAKCEAGFNPNSQSPNGLYAGMFQFDAQTWSSTRNKMGLDPNPDLRRNAEESIRTAAFKIKNGGRGAWPNC